VNVQAFSDCTEITRSTPERAVASRQAWQVKGASPTLSGIDIQGGDTVFLKVDAIRVRGTPLRNKSAARQRRRPRIGARNKDAQAGRSTAILASLEPTLKSVMSAGWRFQGKSTRLSVRSSMAATPPREDHPGTASASPCDDRQVTTLRRQNSDTRRFLSATLLRVQCCWRDSAQKARSGLGGSQQE
jgi:hypothetical protein